MEFGELRPQDMQEVRELLQKQGQSLQDPEPDLTLALAVRQEPGGLIVGVILVHHDSHHGYTNTITIDPQHQQEDLPRQLMDKAMCKLYARGVRCCHLTPDAQHGKGFWDVVRWHATTKPKAEAC